MEADIAAKYLIPFDEHWFKIPVEARELMIATHIARSWIDRLTQEDVRGK
jgi:hypothetical protein